MEAVPRIRVEGLTTQVQAYAEAVESGPSGDRARGEWRGSDELDVAAEVDRGQALLVQETFDPGWHAYEAHRALEIHVDAVGHMLIALAPGTHTIRMVFEAPAEVVAGRALGIVCLLAIAVILARQRRQKKIKNVLAADERR